MTPSDSPAEAVGVLRPVDRLLRAAETYGDEVLALERRIRAWTPGHPTPRLNHDFQQDLISAARAYATSTRRRRRTEGETP